MIFRKMTALLLTPVMACSILCACGSDKKGGSKTGLIEDNPDGHVKLVWYIRSSDPQGFKEVMEEAKIDPYIGFSFDRNAVKTEIANVSAVGEEYKGLGVGLYEDVESTYAEMAEKRRNAGYDIIREEIERQLKEWQNNQ